EARVAGLDDARTARAGARRVVEDALLAARAAVERVGVLVHLAAVALLAVAVGEGRDARVGAAHAVRTRRVAVDGRAGLRAHPAMEDVGLEVGLAAVEGVPVAVAVAGVAARDVAHAGVADRARADEVAQVSA